MKVEKYHASFMGTMGKQLTEAWSIAKALGVEDKVEGPLFEAVLKHHSVKSENDIKAVFVQAGVDAGEFDAARNSFMVKTLTARQEKAAEEFGLTGTPSFYVNGKYQIKNNGIKDGSTEGYGKEFAEVVHQLMATNPRYLQVITQVLSPHLSPADRACLLPLFNQLWCLSSQLKSSTLTVFPNERPGSFGMEYIFSHSARVILLFE